MFRRAIRRNRMSHSYLFHGPSGIGKRRFARMIAQCLLCGRVPDAELDACGECADCRQMQAGTHPDFMEIGCPDGKSEFPVELIAGDTQHRGRAGLCYDISLRPMSGNRRFAVIDDADRFNLESANALLKTLEEPPPYATLILLSEDPATQLPTIRSRCQSVRFSPLPPDDVADLILQLGWTESADEAQQIAGLCEGSLTTAAQLLIPEFQELRHTIRSALSGPDFDSAAVAKTVTESIAACGDTPAQRNAAVWAVRFCVGFFAERLRGGLSHEIEGTSSRQQPSPEQLENLGKLIERSAETTRHIESNLQVALCLHARFDDLSRLQRTASI